MNTIHINKKLLNQYHANELTTDETSQLLEHISHCTYCADLFAESFSEYNRILPAPKNLKESILFQVSKNKEATTHRQFFFYSLRVCTAMCGALFLLFSSFWNPSTILPTPVYTQSYSETFLNHMNDSMNEFTEQVNDKMNRFIIDEPQTNNGGKIND
ncbi:MAG: hypothetical protein ACERKN_13015 [Velocimicrobium sp.]